MKTTTQSNAVITPTIIILLLACAAILFIGLTGKKVPLLSNLKVDIILLVLLGMGICTFGGIGRVAAAGEWTHPLAIVAYLLGAAILIVTLAAFTGWKLPLIQEERQALLAIAVLIAAKVLDAIAHSLISKG